MLELLKYPFFIFIMILSYTGYDMIKEYVVEKKLSSKKIN